MLFPLESGVGWQVCPLLCAGHPDAAPGCISAGTPCSASLLSNFSHEGWRGFQVQLRGAEAAEGRSAEGAGVWVGVVLGGCQGARACIILPPPP